MKVFVTAFSLANQQLIVVTQKRGDLELNTKSFTQMKNTPKEGAMSYRVTTSDCQQKKIVLRSNGLLVC
jgi:hypothetical protein